MVKKDFVSKLSEKMGTKVAAEKALDAVLETIREALVEGESVRFTGDFAFEIVQKAERNGRNPSTGEAIVIPAKKAVRVKVGKGLKTLIENS